MTYAGWRLQSLRFTGKESEESRLDFGSGLTLVFGASNTGKSFAVKALDFMLGSTRELPNIQERRPYDTVWLDLLLRGDRAVSLERAMVGGPFQVHMAGEQPRVLVPRHDPKNPENISTFLLAEMNAAGRKVAIDKSGTPNNLTFRDIADVVLTNEIAIQSEEAPALSGRRDDTREQNALKFVLTGNDDSAVVAVPKPKEFRAGREARIALLEELIDRIQAEILSDYPEPDGLMDQAGRIETTFRAIENEINAARSSIAELLDQKRRLSSAIARAERRSVDAALSLESFERLEEVYVSDVKRLEGLEEAGFLLSLDQRKKACPVCGAPPEVQAHTHGLDEIAQVRIAAELEVQKLMLQREELGRAVRDTAEEAGALTASIEGLRASLSEVERRIADASPSIDVHQDRLRDVIAKRDHVRRGIELLQRREELLAQKREVELAKRPKLVSGLQQALATHVAKEFADEVGQVLRRWGFPGKHEVVFDLSTFDLIIDGKERRNNGKGVRAITHAAFKVALLLYCRARDLPHPGFLVLDSPMLTYRDPLQASETVTAEEERLRKSDLKERFYEHLGHAGPNAQFVVFENTDPPLGIEGYAKLETFTNNPARGRQGLL